MLQTVKFECPSYIFTPHCKKGSLKQIVVNCKEMITLLLIFSVFPYYELYEGRLISDAHSEIFYRRSKVAMLAQCVPVATTLLHSGAKFHSFLYTGSKTVRVNMESCSGGMSTRLKRRAVTEFLGAENVTPAEIHRRLQAVYGEDTVNRTTVNRWAIKFRECEPGRAVCWQDSFDCFLGLTKSLYDRIFGSWENCQFSSEH